MADYTIHEIIYSMSFLLNELNSLRSNNSKINQHLSIRLALENTIRAENNSNASISPLKF